MPKKNNGPSKVFSEYLNYIKQPNVTAKLSSALVQHLKSLNLGIELGETDLNWDDPLIRQAFADSVWKIYPGKLDEPIALAFAKAGLNPKNLVHWRLLFSFFCYAHFSFERVRGAPRRWTGQQYARLLQDAHNVRSAHPKFSKEDVCRTISKHRKYRKTNGQPLSAGRIKTALREARNPECNVWLAAYLQEAIQKFRIHCQEHAQPWSSELEAKYIKQAIEHYSRTIGDAPKRAENK